MDVPASGPPLRYRRYLPYWAVFVTDLKQTFHSWVYRLWVVTTSLAAVGYLLYRFGVHREAGMLQSASAHIHDLFHGVAIAGLAMIVVLTVSSISSERGTLADSILSRGISRYQYFLAKMHARMVVVVLTFILMSAAMLTAFHFLLTEDLSWQGGAIAIAIVGSLLAAVVAWGVAVGALTNSTVVGITILWVTLYGLGFLTSFLPASIPSPERALARLPHILRGYYDRGAAGQWVLGSLMACLAATLIGMFGFSRKDV